ncbi:hypothetical protein SBDP1_1400021 [Syntrophobacter sp. SbD1]|nr:hypothetical protein SBDP1_1400021 [Syntrophobacter sp. SbD1]
MLENVNYDLIQAIAEDSKTIYRIGAYLKDSTECKHCQDIWKEIKQKREQEMNLLINELKKHMQTGHPHEEQASA